MKRPQFFKNTNTLGFKQCWNCTLYCKCNSTYHAELWW